MSIINMYKQMVTIRIVEDKLQELCFKGEAGDLHFNKGQEAISVGVCAALKPTDYIVTHHRTIAHCLAKGANLYPLLAEILGKSTGINKGMAGEMHINMPQIRHMFSFQLVGTCIPVAVGLAYALKYYKKTNDIVAVFFGDAATSNGQFHEGANIAAIKNVPLLMICENNGLAGNITKEYYLPIPSICDRMRAYGISTARIDGNNVQAIRDFVKYTSLEYVRRFSKPCFIEMDTTRLCCHKQGQRDIRTPEQIAKLAERDPILLEEKRLSIAPEQRKKIWDEIAADVDHVLEKVDKDSPSSLSEIVSL